MVVGIHSLGSRIGGADDGRFPSLGQFVQIRIVCFIPWHGERVVIKMLLRKANSPTAKRKDEDDDDTAQVVETNTQTQNAEPTRKWREAGRPPSQHRAALLVDNVCVSRAGLIHRRSSRKILNSQRIKSSAPNACLASSYRKQYRKVRRRQHY